MKLHAVEPGLLYPPGGFTKFLNELVDLIHAHFADGFPLRAFFRVDHFMPG